MTRPSELLPCPFCGGKAVPAHNPFYDDMSMAECERCGATAYDRKWNRREPTPPADVVPSAEHWRRAVDEYLTTLFGEKELLVDGWADIEQRASELAREERR